MADGARGFNFPLPQRSMLRPGEIVVDLFAGGGGAILAQGEHFAACHYDTAHTREFSLRSHATGVDVSAIAGLYGGGGHARAAGFRVPRTHELARA